MQGQLVTILLYTLSFKLNYLGDNGEDLSLYKNDATVSYISGKQKMHVH